MIPLFECKNCHIKFTPKDHSPSHLKRTPPIYCSRECRRIYENAHSRRKTDAEYQRKRMAIPENREKKRESDRAYTRKNREKILLKHKQYYLANRVRMLKYTKEYSALNKEKREEYRLAHKEKIRENHRKWCAKKRRESIVYRLHDNLTSSIGNRFLYGKGGKRTEAILGYSFDDLKKVLEKQFKKGMSWKNYGQWHVDHKIPLSAFNITSPDDLDFKRAWALSNLQPLWKHDNLSKNGRVERPFQPSLNLSI